jgi:KDO2-lipid IV(A) lauroyltransferase
MKQAPRRHRFEYAVYRTLRWLLHRVPHAAVRRLGVVLGAAAFRLDRRHRTAALENLALALPELGDGERRRLARRCFHHFGAALCDTVSAQRFDLEEMCRRVTIEGWDNVQQARGQAAPRGVFAMTAHLGLWEMAALVFGTYGGTLNVVGRPLDNPHLDRELVDHRRRFGNRLLAKRRSIRGMLRGIEAGENVAILIDQRVQPHEGIEVPFFGHPAVTTPVLAKLSIRLGVPVVPAYCLPLPRGRYRVIFKPALEPPVLPAEAGEADEERAVRELTARYLAEMEGEIRRHPHLWLWLHRRWAR